ncbi:MAG: glycosyltransferase family 4 protein [Candidatus Micrarchaeia archaeon]
MSLFRPEIGSGIGALEYAYHLGKHMDHLISKKDSIERMSAFEGPYDNQASGSVYLDSEFKRKLRSIPKDKYDIIHISDHELGFAAKILKESGNRAKIVTTVHSLYRLKPRMLKSVKQSTYDRLVRKSISDAIKYSDMLLCNSSETYKEVEKYFGKHKNMSVIFHGISDEILDMPQPKGKKVGAFTIGYIGALLNYKNVIFIFDAAAYLRGKQYKFLIYGSGSDRKMLEDFKAVNHLNNLNIMGYLNEDKKVKAYDSFDAFVFPSMYEGLGIPILEAKARGLPVIIYKYGTIPEEVRKYCFEVTSPEGMASAIKSIKEKGFDENIRRKAMDSARSFTWDKTARKTLSAYRSILKSKRKAKARAHPAGR